MTLRIGTAGWTLPRQHAHHFPSADALTGSAPEAQPAGEPGAQRAQPTQRTHLQRYAARFGCVEINSSFHRPHQRKTWARWAASTPAGFRFAVKLPKAITHTAKLHNTGALLQEFLDQISGLAEADEPKLGPLLIQLPPSLAFDTGVAHEFLTTLRELHAGAAVLEPRHATWFAPEVDRLLRGFEVARVAADPPKGSPQAGKPGGWSGLRYWRLHGAPRTYYSEYTDEFLQGFAQQLAAADANSAAHAPETWVIFDNTALGHGAGNALRLQELVDDAT